MPEGNSAAASIGLSFGMAVGRIRWAENTLELVVELLRRPLACRR
jgi:ABC-type nitrate/sulfonate/bicarbonate transport system permease component